MLILFHFGVIPVLKHFYKILTVNLNANAKKMTIFNFSYITIIHNTSITVYY